MFAWIVGHPYAYPLLEVLHIAGIGLLFGSLFVFDLRLWGAAPAVPLPALARLALPVTLLGFTLAAGSGLVMFASQATELLANRAFVVKMGLLSVAGINTALFHARGGLARADLTARLQTVFSLGIWLAIMICGRWIAYL
jgi:hypothetical protein